MAIKTVMSLLWPWLVKLLQKGMVLFFLKLSKYSESDCQQPRFLRAADLCSENENDAHKRVVSVAHWLGSQSN